MEVFNYGRNQSKQEGNYPLQNSGDDAENSTFCQVILLQNGGDLNDEKYQTLGWL